MKYSFAWLVLKRDQKGLKTRYVKGQVNRVEHVHHISKAGGPLYKAIKAKADPAAGHNTVHSRTDPS